VNFKIIIIIAALLTVLPAKAQIESHVEIGFMRSMNKVDNSRDPQHSMTVLNRNSLFGQLHASYRINKLFSVGLVLMIQKQDAKIEFDTSYLVKTGRSHIYSPTNMTTQYDHYFMLGPEIGLEHYFNESIGMQCQISALLYDNRQLTPMFDNHFDVYANSLNQSLGSIYAFRTNAEYLNGWNLKGNVSLRLLFKPFINKAHNLTTSFSFGRSVKQNYSVLYETNKPGPTEETNQIRILNYGAYYGISIGYSYTFNLKKENTRLRVFEK